MNSKLFAGTLAMTLFGQYGFCAGNFDWPQWQGPDRTAHSKETGLLAEWPKDGPPLTWKIKGVGGGDSTPSISTGRIYGMSHRGADEIVWARSEKDGKEIWAVRTASPSPDCIAWGRFEMGQPTRDDTPALHKAGKSTTHGPPVAPRKALFTTRRSDGLLPSVSLGLIVG